jgi:hypothetical protein
MVKRDSSPLVCPAGGEEVPHWVRFCHEHGVYISDGAKPADQTAPAKIDRETAPKRRASSPKNAILDAVQEDTTEEKVRLDVMQHLRTLGWTVYSTEAHTHALVDPGVSDLICFLAPRNGRPGVVAFLEIKKPGRRPYTGETMSPEGPCRPEQWLFGLAAREAGAIWRLITSPKQAHDLHLEVTNV